MPGQFHSRYYVETEPRLLEELPQVELSGFAVVQDVNYQK
jgi:hypothetical protein